MKCFVIMPFAKEFGDVYATIRRAVETVRGGSAQTFRLDEVKAAGRITDDLVRVNESAICIADLTGNNPNVMWEVGYAMALRKPVIFISQDVGSLPFDLSLMRTIQYARHSLAETLEGQLAEAFRETLGAFALEREEATRPLPQASVLSVAVTGSMQANRRIRGQQNSAEFGVRVKIPAAEFGIRGQGRSSTLVDFFAEVDCVLQVVKKR
jgi:hypothetical protein